MDAEREPAEQHETQGGFGTGLRAMIERRGEAAQGTPAGETASPAAAAAVPAPPASPPEESSLRAELVAALAREQDLKTALSEQVGAYERKLAQERKSARHAVDLNERGEKLDAIEEQLHHRERRLGQDRKTIEDGRRRLAMLEERAKHQSATAETLTRELEEQRKQATERERALARREADAEQRLGGASKREERLARLEQEVERTEREARARDEQRTAAVAERERQLQARMKDVGDREEALGAREARLAQERQELAARDLEVTGRFETVRDDEARLEEIRGREGAEAEELVRARAHVVKLEQQLSARAEDLSRREAALAEAEAVTLANAEIERIRGELDGRAQELEERDRTLGAEEAKLRDERERLARRDESVRAGQHELSRALTELEVREAELAKRHASFEADLEVRMLEVERREDTLTALEERIDARKRELATLVTRAQAEIQREPHAVA